MIRLVCIATMVLFLCVFFYLPSVYAPDRFLDQIHAEHALNQRYCGEDHALRVLERAMTLHGDVQSAQPISSAVGAVPASNQLDAVAAQRLAEASARLFSNQYTRSLDALLTLFLFRLSGLVEWLPLLASFVLACLLDGCLRRSIKSKQFEQHSAEMFSAFMSLSVFTVCGFLVVALLPVTFHPYALLAPPILVGLFGNQSIANFHARG
ncbi:MAG: DUF4400 domain-containing protein [Candidatus Methylophosphatis roskildensis]